MTNKNGFVRVPDSQFIPGGDDARARLVVHDDGELMFNIGNVRAALADMVDLEKERFERSMRVALDGSDSAMRQAIRSDARLDALKYAIELIDRTLAVNSSRATKYV